MAILAGAAATIEVRPVQRENPGSNWLKTCVGITYHIQDQLFHIELPTKEIIVQIEEFDKFLRRGREHIDSLPFWKTKTHPLLKTYSFTTMEPSFSITLGIGFFDDNRQDGILVITFRLSLSRLRIEKVSTDGLGCDLQVKISDFLLFLESLEQEVNALAQS